MGGNRDTSAPAKDGTRTRRVLRLCRRLLLYLVVAFVVFNLVGIHCATHMERIQSDLVPLDFGMRAEDVAKRTEDGLTLCAGFVPGRGKAPAVVFLHGLGTVKGDLLPMAQPLHKRGYALLFFDFRACGESEGTHSSFGHHEEKDLEAALAFLRSRTDVDADRLGLVGVSMGSAVACRVGARDPRVKAIVLDSTFSSIEDVIANIYRKLHVPPFPLAKLSKWILETWLWADVDATAPVAEAGKIQPRGLLIVSGGQDPIMRPATARRLFDAAGEPKELWRVPEAGHVGAYEARTAEYERKLGAFFGRFLPVDEAKQIPPGEERSAHRPQPAP